MFSQVLIYIAQANARPKRDRQMSTLAVESCSSNLDLNDHHGIHESSDDNDNTYIPEPDEPEESGTEEKKNDEEKGVATDPPKKRMMKNKGKTTSTDGVCSQWPDGRSPAVQAYKVFLHHEWLKHLQAGTLLIINLFVMLLHYLFLSSS